MERWVFLGDRRAWYGTCAAIKPACKLDLPRFVSMVPRQLYPTQACIAATTTTCRVAQCALGHRPKTHTVAPSGQRDSKQLALWRVWMRTPQWQQLQASVIVLDDGFLGARSRWLDQQQCQWSRLASWRNANTSLAWRWWPFVSFGDMARACKFRACAGAGEREQGNRVVSMQEGICRRRSEATVPVCFV